MNERQIKRKVHAPTHRAVVRCGPGFVEDAAAEISRIIASSHIAVAQDREGNDRARNAGRARVRRLRHDVALQRVDFRTLIEITQRALLPADILLSLVRAVAHSQATLDASLETVDWLLYLPAGASVEVSATSRMSALYHEGLLCDRLGASIERAGLARAPDGRRDRPPENGRDRAANGTPSAKETRRFRVHLEVFHDRLEVLLSLCGEPAWKRGYRFTGGAVAPLREDLAQGCVRRALDYARETGPFDPAALFVPFCGTGTLLFESLIALFDIPEFAFGKAIAVDHLACAIPQTSSWIRKKEAERVVHALKGAPTVRAVAIDSDPNAVHATQKNAGQFFSALVRHVAPVGESVNLETRCEDVFRKPWGELTGSGRPGTTIFVPLNPPYGRRVSADAVRPATVYEKTGEEIAALVRSERFDRIGGFVLCPDAQTWGAFLRGAGDRKGNGAGRDGAPTVETRTSHFTQGGMDIRLCAFRSSPVRPSARAPQ